MPPGRKGPPSRCVPGSRGRSGPCRTAAFPEGRRPRAGSLGKQRHLLADVCNTRGRASLWGPHAGRPPLLGSPPAVPWAAEPDALRISQPPAAATEPSGSADRRQPLPSGRVSVRFGFSAAVGRFRVCFSRCLVEPSGAALPVCSVNSRIFFLTWGKNILYLSAQ